MPSGPRTWSCTTWRGFSDHAAPSRCVGGRSRKHDAWFDNKHGRLARPLRALVLTPVALCSSSSSSAPSGCRRARLPQTPPRLARSMYQNMRLTHVCSANTAWDDLHCMLAACYVSHVSSEGHSASAGASPESTSESWVSAVCPGKDSVHCMRALPLSQPEAEVKNPSI